MRSLGGVAAFVVILIIAFAAKFYKRDNMGDKYLAQARQRVMQADKYNEYREQFNWLVETAHEEVFNDSYTMDLSTRRDHSFVDTGKYYKDLFDRMIELAKSNNYYEVADSLERLIDPDAAARQKMAKDAKKTGKK